MGNFQYERCYENSLSTNVEFTASYEGYWYVVLINNQNQDVRLDISFEVY